MKTLLILLMPFVTVTTFLTSSKFFAAEDYYTSAMFTLSSLSALTLFITAISSKKMFRHE